jgi:hypothetical protein
MVLGMIRENIDSMRNRRKETETIVPFPEGPILVNIAESAEPSVQTATTNRTMRNKEVIPVSKYSEWLTDTDNIQSPPNKIPWTINVKNKSFSDAVQGKTIGTNQEPDEETVNSGNTSGFKTVRETELEQENERLNQQLKDNEKKYEDTMERMREELERQRREDKQQQAQSNIERDEKIAMLEEAYTQTAYRCDQLMALLSKTSLTKEETMEFDTDSEESTDETSSAKRQGSTSANTTPRKQKKSRSLLSTPNRSNRSTQQDDASPNPEEGNEIT